MKKTSIGGQAIIEGVMMRGPKKTAMAVRSTEGEIMMESWDTGTATEWYKKAPVIRGVVNMISSLLIGYKCLMRSTELAGMDDEEPSKFEKWLAEKLGASLSSVVAVLALIIGAGLAILLFMVLPTAIAGFIGRFLKSTMLMSVIEGVAKIAILVAYMGAMSAIPDMRRLFEYHGAEHKTIFCYEAGHELTVENVRKQKRFHPRCGTSFILIVLVISIIIFSVVSWQSTIMRIFLKILMLPVVVGISYEIIKFAGKYDNILTRIISAPGLWLQRITTKEPDDMQIEVAIASMKPVIPAEEGSDEW